MTHASLCKKTHNSGTWFQGSGGGLALLFLAAGSLLAQAGPPALKITTSALPNATLGLPYLTAQGSTVQLAATGGNGNPYQWSFFSFSSGTTFGLTFNSDGTITGTPNTVGTLSFGVTVSEPGLEEGSTAQLHISILPCTPSILPASPLPQGDIGIAYPQVNFQIAGCPGSTYSFSAQSVDPFSPNSLPPGLAITSTGALKGIPTTAGVFSFYITLTDQNSQETQLQYSLTINPLPTVSTSSPLPNGPVGVAYSQQITATGGTPPYIFNMNNNPPGLTITQSGVLNGIPTQAGTFSFNIGVVDSLRGQTVSPFQVTFAAAVSQLQVAPLSLTFNANVNGNAPATQAISVVPGNGTTPPVNFHLVVDNGQSNTAQPSWITVTPTSGVSPVGLVVSVDQGTMAAGAYLARIQVLDSNGFAIDVPVTLNVTGAPQQVTVAPAMLNFSARAATPGTLIKEILVANNGGGTLPFSASVLGNSSWISSLTPGSSQTARNTPAFVQVQVNTNGLQVGAYHDAILVSTSAGNTQIPVSLFVAASGPILAVNSTGVLFQAIEDGGSTSSKTVKILNLGDPSSTVSWTASFVGGSSNWLNLVSSSGTATSSAPGALTLALSPNATQLTAGPYYAIVKITDANSLNSPQYVTAVLNLQPGTAFPAPDLAPTGLFFTTPFNGAAPPAQQVQINTSSAPAVTFNATASTFGTGTWLNVTPASGSASGQGAGSVSVSVNPSGLGAGIYSGNVNVSIGAFLQSVNVTFVVQPNGASNTVSQFRPQAVSCAASKLAITETGLANNFAVPAGWPATLIVQLDDDCASPVTNGSVVASFSNGDAPLNLASDSLGNYSATWQPGAVNANMVVTLNATAGGLKAATAQLYGGVAQNQTPPPTLVPGGTLNNLNPVVGAPLSPGTIVAVYGTGLGTSPVSTGGAPLPQTFDNTFALVGSSQAPLYFLSNGQINLQIPNDASATQQLPIVLSVNNALTLPLVLDIVPVAPGVAAYSSGDMIAQHADYSLVSSSSPAKPGEVVIMYLVGMGATNPSVPSGTAAPGPPNFATTVVQPIVTVGSQQANVVFAGLTPDSVGLYQIDFQVPTGAASGDLDVTVTQNGVAANTTKLPVSQ
ncbi:MAG TPA: hypothetical protein VK708_08045 [Bryobacteraceae bacterium]|nr:hypothetical protein [Bryobacteraceae bacterium]